MNLGGHDIGVCSWSLKPESMTDLISALDSLQLDHTQLALVPLLQLSEDDRKKEIDILNNAEIALTGGMYNFIGENYASIGMIRKTGGLVPDNFWPERREMSFKIAALAKQVGIDRITMHLGFLPPSSDAGYAKLITRAGEIADAYEADDIKLLLETGQERANDLLHFINDLNKPNVGVNLDPANMILYGSGDPVEAVQILGRHIGHVHIKDAVGSSNPGTEWGKEVPFGRGDIDHVAMLQALESVEYTGPLVIECLNNAGNQDCIVTAIEKLTDLMSESASA